MAGTFDDSAEPGQNLTATMDSSDMDINLVLPRNEGGPTSENGCMDVAGTLPQNPAYSFALPDETPSYPPVEPTPCSSADDYRSVIDDLTIENKRLKEELKRYRQFSSRDVPEREKLFEIKVHGLPSRKKQQLEATLRDFAMSLGDSSSTASASQRKRGKSASSRHVLGRPHNDSNGSNGSNDKSNNNNNGSNDGNGNGNRNNGNNGKNSSNSKNHNSSSQSRHMSGDTRSKHASISSSRSQPIDSAYASMSVGANSSGPALVRPSFGGPQARTSEQKVERYLQDIPEGLHPNYRLSVLSDKDKMKLIVRRLEQLFTGKISGRYTHKGRKMLPPAIVSLGESGGTVTPAAATAADDKQDKQDKQAGAAGMDAGAGGRMPSRFQAAGGAAGAAGAAGLGLAGVPLASLRTGPTREARIQPRHGSHNTGETRDNTSTSNSNSNGDEAGNGKNGNGHGGNGGSGSGSGKGKGKEDENDRGGGGGGGGHKARKPSAQSEEQRPTRPRDLDPDRVQVPAENMEYIRHLGLVPPEIGPESKATMADVSPDADGWAYLNLLSNLAQLHIFNVAPDFIRKAIVEKSTKFQLSPDGQKIRWRGGTDGTKFSSDSGTGDSSRQSPSTDDGDGSDENGQRKRPKTAGNGSSSTQSSSKKLSRCGPQASASSSDFHYKPLFANRSRSRRSALLVSADESESQDGDPMDDSYVTTTRIGMNNSKSNGNSGYDTHPGTGVSGSSQRRKKRRANGVLVYYSGAPFCTDLAGDSSGDSSLTTDVASSDQAKDSMDTGSSGQQPKPQIRPVIHRSSSGSYLPFHPLTDCVSLSAIHDAESSELRYRMSNRGATDNVADSMSNLDSFQSFQSLQSFQSPGSLPDSIDDGTLTYFGDSDSAASDTVQVPSEPVLEASGLNRVFPEDHFSVLVTTKRPFRARHSSAHDDHYHNSGGGGAGGAGGAGGGADDSNGNDDGHHRPAEGPFNMASLMKRLAALREQTAPISAAVAHESSSSTSAAALPPVKIAYVSARVGRRKPVSLPPPAVLYPPFSAASGSDSDSDSLVEDSDEDEDESMLASSSDEMISRRPNPNSHHSGNHLSPAAHEMISSGDISDEEPGSVEMDSSFDDRE